MNNTAKHTPGPWVVSEYSSGMICVDGLDGKSLCAVGYNRTDGRDDIANAHLIAAAPAMYEALKDAIACIERTLTRKEINERRNRINTALAQAEGK